MASAPIHRPVITLAPLRRRLVANLIDGLPVALCLGLMWHQGWGGLDALHPPDPAFWPEFYADLYWQAPRTLLYPWGWCAALATAWSTLWLMTLYRSPGQMLTRVWLVDATKQRPSRLQLAVRCLVYPIAWLSLGLGWSLAFILPSRRTLHDLLGGTYLSQNPPQVQDKGQDP